MQCSNCGKDAVIRINWKEKNYCVNHFKRYFLGHVGKVINKYGVSGRVMVAVSGGKDSSTCLEALTHFENIEVVPFHINLGIDEYSEKSLEVARKVCDGIGLDLNVLDLKEKYGKTIPEINDERDAKVCGICGMIKRYLMNRYADENGYDYVATGHNLSDEVASTFNNLANVYLTPFRGLKPVLEEKKEYNLVARVKPLYFLKDRECLVYAETNNITFFSEECPLSLGSPTNELKEWLHKLDSERPKILRNFAKSFMRIEERMDTDHEGLKRCDNCGYATATEVCRFCRVLELSS